MFMIKDNDLFVQGINIPLSKDDRKDAQLAAVRSHVAEGERLCGHG